MRLQKTVNSPTHLRTIQHKQGRDGGNNKAPAHISAPQSTARHPLRLPLTSRCYSSSTRSLPFFHSLFLSFFSSSPLSPAIHPSSPPSLPPHLSTVVALVTIQRDFLRSSVTVATLGFPPDRCWKRAALRPSPAGSC